MSKKIIIIWIHILFALSLFSQEDIEKPVLKIDASKIEQKQFDANKINALSKEESFIYTVDLKENSFTEFKRWIKDSIERFLDNTFETETAKTILKVIAEIVSFLPYLIILLLLYFIIRFFVRKGYFSFKGVPKDKKIITFSDEETIIKEADLPKLIEEAVSDGNYRLAIRYRYLFLLKILQDAEKILWAQQKTNEDYFEEIEEEELKTSFKTATDFYDYIWFGDFSISELEYHRLILSFEKINKTLKGNA